MRIDSVESFDISLPGDKFFVHQAGADFTARTKFIAKSEALYQVSVHRPHFLNQSWKVIGRGWGQCTFLHFCLDGSKDYDQISNPVVMKPLHVEKSRENSSSAGKMDMHWKNEMTYVMKPMEIWKIEKDILTRRKSTRYEAIHSYPELLAHRNACINFAVSRIVEAYRPRLNRSAGDSRVVYVGPANHGNLGDVSLSRGTMILLEDYLKMSVDFCGDSQSHRPPDLDIPRCSDEELINRAGGVNVGAMVYHGSNITLIRSYGEFDINDSFFYNS